MNVKKILSLLSAAVAALIIVTIVPFNAGATDVAENVSRSYTNDYSDASTEDTSADSTAEIVSAKAEENEFQLGADVASEPENTAEPEEKEVPSAPTLSLSNTVNGLTAAWGKVDNAEYYTVYYKSTSDEEWTSFDTSEISCNIPDAVSGELYFVKVQSMGADELSGEFSKVKSLTCISRAEITGLSFNGSADTLSWNSVGGANKYQIAKKRSVDSSYTYYTTTSTTFTDKNVSIANTYRYQVRAMYATDQNGTAYGAWSSTKSVVTLATANVSLANKSNGIRASWNAVSGASRYAVYYRSSDDTKWSTASTTNTYYPILNVKSGSLYFVQVRAVAGKISGTYSKVKAMTFIAPPSVTLSNSADGIKVSWKDVEGANKYQIAKKKKGASSFEYFTSESASYTDKAVSGNTEYYYQVRAMYATETNGTAYGAWSSAKSILKMVQPSVTLSNKSNGMRVEWNKVAGAVKYVVYIKAASASSWQSATTTNNYYQMLTVKSGVLYYVQVRPVGSGVYGPFSNPKSLTYIGPANLSLSMQGSDLKLGWNSVAGANKYQIAKLKKGDSSFEYIISTGTSYIDKAVTGSKDFYSYQVRALYETENSGTAYGAWSSAWHFNNGKIVFDGYQIINGNKYYYQNGVVQKNGIVGNSRDGYCYADKNGKIDTSYRGAVTSNGADWIVQNGSATKVTTAADRNLFRAMKLVAKLTTNSMSNEQKLKVCFEHLKNNYVEKNPRIPHYHGMDWPVIYANDILANGTGNCFSFGSTFCYMAKAIGYTNVYACNSGGHGWAEVNGLVYDPEWARHRNQYSYFALSYNANTDVNYKAGIAPGQAWMHVKV